MMAQMNCGKGGRVAEDTIACMEEGKEGYVVPWAIFADLRGDFFISGSDTVWTDPNRNAKVKIKKQDGIILVDRHTITKKYNPPGQRYAGDEPVRDYLPVQLVDGEKLTKMEKFKRYIFVLQAKLHFALRPYKRGFYDGLADARGDELRFGG